jgi:hypothetical protein
MSSQQRPLNSSYKKAIAEQAAAQERQRVFHREHQAKIDRWGATTPYGIPGPAGPGPTQSNESTGHVGMSPDDRKA